MHAQDTYQDEEVGPIGHFVHYTLRHVLLCHDTLWAKKNAGATYQRTMQCCLHDQIGQNVHAYVDDIAVMSKKSNDLISDLKETFDNLRKYNMMLNPKKCVFGVPAGKLLGFIIS